jgi:flavin-dependent thymidylate synthase
MIPEWLRVYRKGKFMDTVGPSRNPFEEGGGGETALLRDVAFNRHSMNDGHHVSPLDNGKVQVGADGIEVVMVQGLNEDSFKRVLSMATRATIGIDLSREYSVGEWEPCPGYNEANGQAFPPDCRHTEHEMGMHRGEHQWLGRTGAEDWEEMLKGGLQTALETAVVVFAVSGVSRTCTHQLVRSRRASFHQQSQRASYYGDNPEIRIPESVWRNEAARLAFLRAMQAAHLAYRVACEQDISYQDARYILPEGTTNYIMCEYTLREFIDVFAYRGCSMFSWEIVCVMRHMRELLLDAYPWLEPYVKISCEKTPPRTETFGVGHSTVVAEHSCTFQGWENVEGQCAFPWAKEANRTFRSEVHQIGRRNA